MADGDPAHSHAPADAGAPLCAAGGRAPLFRATRTYWLAELSIGVEFLPGGAWSGDPWEYDFAYDWRVSLGMAPDGARGSCAMRRELGAARGTAAPSPDTGGVAAGYLDAGGAHACGLAFDAAGGTASLLFGTRRAAYVVPVAAAGPGAWTGSLLADARGAQYGPGSGRDCVVTLGLAFSPHPHNPACPHAPAN